MSLVGLSRVAAALSFCFLTAQAAWAAAPANVAPAAELPPPVSTNDPAPTAPSPVVGRQVGLIHQAGRGSPTGYARMGVLELGGGLSFNRANDYLALGINPQVGYFLANNFQLSFIGNLSYNHVRVSSTSATPPVEKPITVAMLVQPSWHLPLQDVLFIYGGLGVGAAYQKPNKANNGDHGWGFAFAPEVGFNLLVGRSGIISPSVNVLFATTDIEKVSKGNGETQTTSTRVGINTNVGVNVRYSLMF